MNEYYGKYKQAHVDDNDKVYAKKEWDGKKFNYSVRAATTGPDVPHLLNPWGIHFTEGVDETRVVRQTGKRRYEYRKVSEEVYNLYLLFLESGSDRLYRQTERILD